MSPRSRLPGGRYAVEYLEARRYYGSGSGGAGSPGSLEVQMGQAQLRELWVRMQSASKGTKVPHSRGQEVGRSEQALTA